MTKRSILAIVVTVLISCRGDGTVHSPVGILPQTDSATGLKKVLAKLASTECSSMHRFLWMATKTSGSALEGRGWSMTKAALEAQGMSILDDRMYGTSAGSVAIRAIENGYRLGGAIAHHIDLIVYLGGAGPDQSVKKVSAVLWLPGRHRYAEIVESYPGETLAGRFLRDSRTAVRGNRFHKAGAVYFMWLSVCPTFAHGAPPEGWSSGVLAQAKFWDTKDRFAARLSLEATSALEPRRIAGRIVEKGFVPKDIVGEFEPSRFFASGWVPRSR